MARFDALRKGLAAKRRAAAGAAHGAGLDDRALCTRQLDWVCGRLQTGTAAEQTVDFACWASAVGRSATVDPKPTLSLCQVWDC